jgi:predicted nucleotidyltransferase
MILIEEYRDQIQRLCENHNVKSLYSIGSVNTDYFSPDSDVDLVVDFNIEDPIAYTENYFDFKFDLEKMLNREIDLLESKAIKNPFLKENIDKSQVLVYGQ